MMVYTVPGCKWSHPKITIVHNHRVQNLESHKAKALLHKQGKLVKAFHYIQIFGESEVNGPSNMVRLNLHEGSLRTPAIPKYRDSNSNGSQPIN
jgi:hypothetical protein